MTNDEIINELRAAGPGRSATDLAELLNSLTQGGLSQATLVTYFKRAFPGVPLRVLIEVGTWHRISGGPMTDAEVDELLRPSLP